MVIIGKPKMAVAAVLQAGTTTVILPVLVALASCA